jgi:hypothetical protein
MLRLRKSLLKTSYMGECTAKVRSKGCKIFPDRRGKAPLTIEAQPTHHNVAPTASVSISQLVGFMQLQAEYYRQVYGNQDESAYICFLNCMGEAGLIRNRDVDTCN